MNYTQLKYFCEIVDHMSFTKAADALYISQSALSKSISALESELKSPLFIRHGKNLSLTRHGKILLVPARELLAFTDQKMNEIYTRFGLSNEKLSIGIPPTAGAIFFHRVVKRFQQSYPDTEISIQEGTSKAVLKRILDMDEDIGIVIEPVADKQLEKFPVVRSEAVVLISSGHPLADRKTVRLEELKDENFVMISSDFMFYDLVMQKCREAGFAPAISFSSLHWEWLFSMVIENEAITILPYPLVEPYLTDSVRAIHISEPEIPWTLSVIYNRSSILSSSMRLFLEICREESALEPVKSPLKK